MIMQNLTLNRSKVKKHWKQAEKGVARKYFCIQHGTGPRTITAC